MQGMDAATGKMIEADGHLDQSLENIITTLLQTLVLRRDYGSSCVSLKDKLLNSATIMKYYGCISDAIRKWEPRLILRRILARREGEGKLYIDLYGDVRDVKTNTITTTGIKISVPLLNRPTVPARQAVPEIKNNGNNVKTYTFAGGDALELPTEPLGVCECLLMVSGKHRHL